MKTDAEYFQWLAHHPTAAAGIVNQFHDQIVYSRHWNETREQRESHLKKLIDYNIRYTREEHKEGCPCRINARDECECGL